MIVNYYHRELKMFNFFRKLKYNYLLWRVWRYTIDGNFFITLWSPSNNKIWVYKRLKSINNMLVKKNDVSKNEKILVEEVKTKTSFGRSYLPTFSIFL